MSLEQERGYRYPSNEVAGRRIDHGADGPVMTIVVPTRNEGTNVAPLVERVERALPAGSSTVVFVDDSDDDTPARVREVAEQSRSVNIRLIHRVKKDRKGGLGGAVVAGFRSASTPWLAVMDGDLQHPPELLAQLLDTAQTTGADVVVASRYLDGGDGSALGGTRLRLSHSATKVARILFPHRLNAVTDPMSGFFVVRADAIDLDLLQPDGFKILVEILLRGRPLSVAEVGYRFGHRASGSSKASAREGTRYVTRLVGLRWQALLHNGGTR